MQLGAWRSAKGWKESHLEADPPARLFRVTLHVGASHLDLPLRLTWSSD